MHTLPKHSFYTMRLARGCQLCQEGAKLVLLITGMCSSQCFYCPLSEKKRGRDVVYANELLVKSDNDIIEEAELIEAEGAGITGGDPLDVIDRTVHAISLLKEYFGEDFHIHLYTASFDEKKVARLERAGLDEIRFHPDAKEWHRIEDTGFKSLIEKITICKGMEIPLIPHLKEETVHLLECVDAYGLDFINVNELEFSPTNMEALDALEYVTKSDESAAVKGSEEMAYELVELGLVTPFHYCSASFKDGVQLRKRIERRARNVARPYELITEDGTLLKGIILVEREAMEQIKREFDIGNDMMAWNEEKQRVETSPFILEEIAGYLHYKCYIIEEYPTADRLEVERTPLS